MKSIKKQLLLTILGVVSGFGIIIFVVTLSKLVGQKNAIEAVGRQEAQMLSEETAQTFEELNRQVAKDFSGACTKYFNQKFSSIRKHVGAVQKEVTALYKEGEIHGNMDENVGLVRGVSKAEVREEFGVISPIRDFIKYLPEYDKKEMERLDLYVMTQSGMCLDGTGEALGNQYADLRKEDWYRKAGKLGKGKIYWSNLFRGKVTRSDKVTCAMPVYDTDGIFRGCVSGDVAVGGFQDIIEEFDEKQIASVIFFDKSEKLMYATNGYKKTDRVKQYLGREDIVSLENEIYSFTTLEETGWTICLVLNQENVRQITKKLQMDIEENVAEILEIMQEGIRETIIFFAASMAAGVFFAVLASHFLAAGFVRPIRELMFQVREVGAGSLEHNIAVSSKNEIGQLAEAFREMTCQLKSHMENLKSMTADKERITAELNAARQIQMNMLPDKFPAFPERNEFDIYAVINPVSTDGSNFYDFFLIDKTHLCVVIGDVSGTGIQTALFAVITKTHIKNYAQLGYESDRILAKTNNRLSDKNDAGLSVSVFIGIIDLKTGIFQYSNSGQMLPLWKHSGKDFEFLEAKSGFSLAGMENVPYQKQSVRFTQGDMLFLYTRGVPETADGRGSEYTQEYLQEYLNLAVKRRYYLSEIADSIMLDLREFSDGKQQREDSTFMLLRYFGM